MILIFLYLRVWLKITFAFLILKEQKEPSRGIHRKRYSENMRQIYRRAPMPKSNFIEIVLRHGCSPVNLLDIFRTPFLKNTLE